MKMLDFKVKRFVGIIFHLILAQICLAQTVSLTKILERILCN